MRRVFTKAFAFIVTAAGVAVVGPAPVSAQDATQEPTSRTDTVRERARPEYDARGIRMGGFLLYPDVTTALLYDDNIFAEEDDTTSDFIGIISPQLQLRSDWNNHELNLGVRADVGRYFDENSEDYEDLLLEGAGRIDITRSTNIFGTYAHAKRHEDRSSPDDAGGIEPSELDTDQPTLGVSHKFNRISIVGEGGLRRFDFDDVQTSSGTPVNNDDRDRWEIETAATISYEINPEFDAFITGGYNFRKYRDAFDDNGFDRESDGFEVGAGTAIDFTGVIFGNIFVGYRQQMFDDERFDNVDGISGGFDLTWNPTRLTTVNGLVERSVEETTISGSSAVFASRFAASVDHELFRNLLLNASGGVQILNYEAVDRDDFLYRFQASAKYLFSRNFYLTLGYEFKRRDSTGDRASEDFTVNTFLVRVESQL